MKKKLPSAFLSLFPEGVDIAFAAIPSIGKLDDGLKLQVRTAFTDSLSIIWKTMIGIAGIGLLSVFLLEELKMQSTKDERFGLTVEPEQDIEKSTLDIRRVSVDGATLT